MATNKGTMIKSVAGDALQGDFTAVFVGATSGIGLKTLEALCREIPQGRFYVIGRSKARFQPEVEKLSKLKHSAAIVFIEAEVALIQGVDQACATICAREKRLDLLYMSAGYLGAGGPHYTSEGLDKCLALSVFGRMRFCQRLAPLLEAAKSPRIVSVLAGGHEAPLFTQDGDLALSLHGGKNYTTLRVVNQATTLHTLALIDFAAHHPQLSLLHTHPGLVSTGFLERLLESCGPWMSFVSSTVLFLYRRIAMSAEASGEQQAQFCLSPRFPSRRAVMCGTVLTNDVAESHARHSGLYLVQPDGSTCISRKILGPLEAEDWPARVGRFISCKFEEALSAGKH